MDAVIRQDFLASSVFLGVATGERAHFVGDEEGQHVEAHIAQHAVIDGPQQMAHIAAPAAQVAIFRFGGRGGHDGRAPAPETALFVGAGVIVGEAVGHHPVDPALHDSRHAEPPERELQNQEIAPQQLFLLGHHVRRLGAGFLGVALRRHVLETIRIGQGFEFPRPAHRVELVRVEIVDADLVTLLGECGGGNVDQGVIERFPVGFGVGKDDQYLHEFLPCLATALTGAPGMLVDFAAGEYRLIDGAGAGARVRPRSRAGRAARRPRRWPR